VRHGGRCPHTTGALNRERGESWGEIVRYTRVRVCSILGRSTKKTVMGLKGRGRRGCGGLGKGDSIKKKNFPIREAGKNLLHCESEKSGNRR